MDVLFLLKAGGHFEDMKTFVKAFIRQADIGGTRLSSPLSLPLFVFISTSVVKQTMSDEYRRYAWPSSSWFCTQAPT